MMECPWTILPGGLSLLGILSNAFQTTRSGTTASTPRSRTWTPIGNAAHLFLLFTCGLRQEMRMQTGETGVDGQVICHALASPSHLHQLSAAYEMQMAYRNEF